MEKEQSEVADPKHSLVVRGGTLVRVGRGACFPWRSDFVLTVDRPVFEGVFAEAPGPA